MSNRLNKTCRIGGPIIITLQFVVAIYLARTVNFPDPPPQKSSRLTGLPIWEEATPSANHLNTLTNISDYVAAIITGVASATAIFFAARKVENKFSRVPTGSSSSGNTVHTTNQITWTKYLLSTILTAYISATFLALAAGIIVGLGKLWSIVGIFHNIMEVCLLGALFQTNRKQYNFAMALIVVVIYSVVATAITSQAEWYYDQLFFKFQGLILDFLLPLAFFRVATNTGSTNPGDTESTPLLPGGNNVNNSTYNPPKQLRYLVFASLVHLIGNAANLVGDNSESSSLIFNLSYLIAFPIYTIYVRNESNMKDDEKPYDVPYTSFYELVLFFMWAISASAITALISVYNMTN